MTAHDTFRVVGVRLDGTRALLLEGLTRERADYVQEKLSGLAAFRELLVEKDSGGASADPLLERFG